MIPPSAEAGVLRMIRLAPAHLRSTNADFFRHVYREGLGREPEFDLSGSNAPDFGSDIYSGRTGFIRAVVLSDEGRQRGHDATLVAFAAMLGYAQHRLAIVEALRALYPSESDFIPAVDSLISQICENSRRQDRIIAACSAT